MKQKKEVLHVRTKEVIEGLSEDDALQIVEHKWISPLVKDLDAISLAIVMDVISMMDYLSSKYSTTMHDIQSEKEEVKYSLAEMVGMLKAKGSDLEGLQEFKLIFGGNI